MSHHEATHAGHADGDHAAGKPHTGWKGYVVIGVILAILTVLEVAAVEVEFLPQAIIMPVLLVLTAAKFFLVVLYFMHLKVDHPIFGRVFWAPMVLAILVVVGMIILFKVLPQYGVFS